MKKEMNASHIAPLIAERIEDCIAICTAIDILKLATAGNQPEAIRYLTTDIELAAARCRGTLQGLLWELGYEIRSASPTKRVCVPLGTPVHESLEFAGTVGEGCLIESENDAGKSEKLASEKKPGSPKMSAGKGKTNTARVNSATSRSNGKV